MSEDLNTKFQFISISTSLSTINHLYHITDQSPMKSNVILLMKILISEFNQADNMRNTKFYLFGNI